MKKIKLPDKVFSTIALCLLVLAAVGFWIILCCAGMYIIQQYFPLVHLSSIASVGCIPIALLFMYVFIFSDN